MVSLTNLLIINIQPIRRSPRNDGIALLICLQYYGYYFINILISHFELRWRRDTQIRKT